MRNVDYVLIHLLFEYFRQILTREEETIRIVQTSCADAGKTVLNTCN